MYTNYDQLNGKHLPVGVLLAEPETTAEGTLLAASDCLTVLGVLLIDLSTLGAESNIASGTSWVFSEVIIERSLKDQS
jgi:hypothetical protein